MAYTKQQIRDIIYAKVIDNVSEEITPEDMRYTLDAMTDAIFEAQAVASGFFFGPWKAQAFKTGWVAISSDGKKFWQSLQDFNSATEPTVNTAYWKLIAELKGDADFSLYLAYEEAAPVEDADIAALQKADGTKRKLTWLQLKTWLYSSLGFAKTVNNQAPEAATGNITLEGQHIAVTPASTTFWGAGPHTAKSMFDALVSKISASGNVDTVNTIAPDAGTKNITLTSANIDTTVNDTTWWGTATLKIKGAFDYVANKIKLLEGRVTTLESSGGGGTGGSATLLGAFGADETAGLHQAFLTSEIRDKRPTYDQVPSLSQAQKDALNTGETYVFTAQKQADASVKWGAGVGTLNKFAPDSLNNLLADSNPDWNGQLITLNGDNASKQIGKAGQEKTQGRRWYLCKSSTSNSATWERNSTVSMLDSANSHDSSIIAQLQEEAGWSNNNKTITAKSCKGDEYTSDTGYVYTCYNNTNGWRRIGEPKTASMFIYRVGDNVALCDKLLAHDFTLGYYDAKADTSYSSYKGKQGQIFYDKATRKQFQCKESNANAIIWDNK